MRLNETEMVKLLPAWMQEDGSDKGIATGCDIISRDAYARLKLLSRWDKIDQLSDAELDEMAWELNIQWYDSTAPIAAKRAVIRNSDRVYAKLGTPYAVEQIVADYFGTGEVREWYQYGGQPHHFKVLSDNPSLVNSNLDLFLKLLRTVKRRSSWLDAILICLTGEMFLYSGMAVRDHTQELHVMGSDEIHIYHAAVVHDNNRETVSIGTDAAVISDYASWTGHISHGNTYHLRQNMDAYFFSYFPELKPSPKGDNTHGPKTEQPRKQVEGQVRQPVRQPDRLDRGR